MSVFNTKDKLEYFKNNVQGEEQVQTNNEFVNIWMIITLFVKNEFDPSQYYYNRDSSAQSDQQHQLTNGYNLDNYGGLFLTALEMGF